MNIANTVQHHLADIERCGRLALPCITQRYPTSMDRAALSRLIQSLDELHKLLIEFAEFIEKEPKEYREAVD